MAKDAWIVATGMPWILNWPRSTEWKTNQYSAFLRHSYVDHITYVRCTPAYRDFNTITIYSLCTWSENFMKQCNLFLENFIHDLIIVEENNAGTENMKGIIFVFLRSSIRKDVSVTGTLLNVPISYGMLIVWITVNVWYLF